MSKITEEPYANIRKVKQPRRHAMAADVEEVIDTNVI